VFFAHKRIEFFLKSHSTKQRGAWISSGRGEIPCSRCDAQGSFTYFL